METEIVLKETELCENTCPREWPTLRKQRVPNQPREVRAGTWGPDLSSSSTALAVVLRPKRSRRNNAYPPSCRTTAITGWRELTLISENAGHRQSGGAVVAKAAACAGVPAILCKQGTRRAERLGVGSAAKTIGALRPAPARIRVPYRVQSNAAVWRGKRSMTLAYEIPHGCSLVATGVTRRRRTRRPLSRTRPPLAFTPGSAFPPTN